VGVDPGGWEVTSFSERYYGLICQYCIHGRGSGCRKDVPWYCVSLGCDFFEEGEPVVVEAAPRKPGKVFNPDHILVDTF
jgi:hypothetical protein